MKLVGDDIENTSRWGFCLSEAYTWGMGMIGLEFYNQLKKFRWGPQMEALPQCECYLDVGVLCNTSYIALGLPKPYYFYKGYYQRGA